MLKTLHPGRFPEGFPEGKPEGLLQWAKHCIPEGIRKVPEGFPEAGPEGSVQLYTLFRSSLNQSWFELEGIWKLHWQKKAAW